MLHFSNAEARDITMVSDPSSTGHPVYGTWNNTGSRPENYIFDDANLDKGEAIRLDTDGDGDMTDETWLRATDFDRYSLDVKMVDGSIIQGVGIILTGTDLATGNTYQTMVFGDLLVQALNDSGMNVQNITLTGYIPVSPVGLDLTDVLQMANFNNVVADYSIAPCFVRGTLIETDMGQRRIETLRAGDRVLTADHGYQPIRWVGSRQVPAQDKMAPICIRKGALANDCDLWVSPQHRMLISGAQAQSLYGEAEVLVPAKALVNDHDITIEAGGMVNYFHVLLDRHEVIFANATPAESLYLGGQALKGLKGCDREEIMALFPELKVGIRPSQARPLLTVRQGRELVEAQAKAA